MTTQEMLSHVDHTLLQATATWPQIEALCREAIEYRTASVCIPPCYIRRVRETFGSAVTICTVIGFPNGNCTTATKVFETENAVANGADEVRTPQEAVENGSVPTLQQCIQRMDAKTLHEFFNSQWLRHCLFFTEEGKDKNWLQTPMDVLRDKEDKHINSSMKKELDLLFGKYLRD